MIVGVEVSSILILSVGQSSTAAAAAAAPSVQQQHRLPTSS